MKNPLVSLSAAMIMALSATGLSVAADVTGMAKDQATEMAKDQVMGGSTPEMPGAAAAGAGAVPSVPAGGDVTGMAKDAAADAAEDAAKDAAADQAKQLMK